MKGNYDLNKSLIENAFMKAEYYERKGDKERAEYFLKIAEKIEKILNKQKYIDKLNQEGGY